MSAPRYLDPSSSVLAYFGAELRRLRAAAGISQEDLAQRISYSASLVGMIETARRAPARDFALGPPLLLTPAQWRTLTATLRARS